MEGEAVLRDGSLGGTSFRGPRWFPGSWLGKRLRGGAAGLGSTAGDGCCEEGMPPVAAQRGVWVRGMVPMRRTLGNRRETPPRPLP